jgi:hypothetical protein
VKSGKPALVTTLRLFSEGRTWAPKVLHNVGNEGPSEDTRLQDGPTPSTKLVDVALCTSAAPLYFPPHEHPNFGYCVDVGLFANCPATISLAVALRAHPGSFEDLRILSIGTGAPASGIDLERSSPFDDPDDYGGLAWLDPIPRGPTMEGAEKLTPVFPLLSIMLDASSASHNYICIQSLHGRYRRVQVTSRRPIALDATDERSLNALENAADLIPAEEWKKTTDWLKEQLG